MSDTPTSSASVELDIMIFRLVEALYNAPLPELMTDPVLLLMSSCIANDASIHHSDTFFGPIDRMSGRCTVEIRYFIVLANFFWSSLSGLLTRVQ